MIYESEVIFFEILKTVIYSIIHIVKLNITNSYLEVFHHKIFVIILISIQSNFVT